jgi:hypothetical protein
MADIKAFMSGVLAITPRYGDIMVNGIPGEGMPNMDADVVNELRKMATLFAHAYKNPNTDEQALFGLATSTEAALMAAVTVGATNEQVAEPLIDELHQLVAEKSSPATA